MVFTVVDIETTGLSKNEHQITEIAGIKSDGRRVLDEFHTLVNPQVRISPFITRLTGIDNELVKEAPMIRDVIGEFTDFLGDSVFVAHNATFDYGFLSRNAEINGIELANRRLCTRKLAVRLLPMLRYKRLDALCDHFHIINEREHRAMGDAHATLCIFNNFRKMMLRMGLEELDDVIRFERMSKRAIIDKYGAPWITGNSV